MCVVRLCEPRLALLSLMLSSMPDAGPVHKETQRLPDLELSSDGFLDVKDEYLGPEDTRFKAAVLRSMHLGINHRCICIVI